MESWIRGLNLLVSNTQVKANELTEAIDVQLVEDGKISFPRDGQAYYGIAINSRIRGLFPFAKSDGTKKLVVASSGSLYTYTTTTAVAITGFSYTPSLDTNAVMAYDRLYVCNGTDPLTYYDGSSCVSFSAVAVPGTPSVVRTSGSTGTFVHSYKITAVTRVGETTPSVASSAVCSLSTLNSTAYTTVAFTASASSDAIGYNIYKENGGVYYFLKYLDGNTSVSYLDQGVDTLSTFFTAPEGNTTNGPVGKYIALYKNTLLIAGDPANPSRIYYSGGGDKIHDFSSSGGGGFFDVAKNDGQKVTGMIVFKDALLIFKEDSTYRFTFTSTIFQLDQINPLVGCIAPRSIVGVENDVFFLSRRGIFTIGNEQGFAFDVLRTNEISAKVRPVVQTIDTAYMDKVSAIYATVANKNLVIFSYTPSGSTTNSKALVYDRERLGWYKWTNINANCFTSYIDSSGVNHIIYGADNSGYVCEILTGSDDFGSAILGTVRLRAESFDDLARYKKLRDLDIIIRKPVGTFVLNLITDGVTQALTVPITSVNPSVNFGHYTFTNFTFSDSIGTGLSSQDENLLRTMKNIGTVARSFMLEFKNTSNASFTLLGVKMSSKPRSESYRGVEDLVS